MKTGAYSEGRAIVLTRENPRPQSEERSIRFSTLHARGVLTVIAISLVLAVITANECHGVFKAIHSSVPFSPSLLFGLVMWLWWGCVAAAIWWWAQSRPEILSFSGKGILLHLGMGSLLVGCHLVLMQETLRIIGTFWHEWRMTYASLNYLSLRRFGTEFMIYGFVFGISGLLNMQSQKQRDAMQKLELERQLTQAQLKALQMQMEPHFLFNTLNAITSLMVQGRNKEAIKTMTHLNNILRTTLQRKAPEKVPFAEELRVVESYLAIQQVRFAGRLEVKIDATPEAMDGLVPCFLLQPIVENAIKHGISPMEAGGLIEASVKRSGDTLWMQVKDNGRGPGNSGTKGHGIGMQNIRERLAYFYPNAYAFNAVAPVGGGYEVTIQIPYERAMA
jgi:two-component sensor histidine kinase